MSTILTVAGALAFLAGLVAIGFGSPASALDFGNTLIEAGTTAAVGGLITIALGAVVGRLSRIAELLSAPLPHEHEHLAHPPASPIPASPPIPAPPASPAPITQAEPRSAPEPHPFEPRGPSTPPEFPPFVPTPPKSAEPLFAMPEPPAPAPKAEPEPEPAPEPEPDLHQAEEPAVPPEPAAPPPPIPEPVPPELPPKSFFDSVWPEERATTSASEPPPEPEPEPPPPPEPRRPAPEKPRAVAVLKSGVVDGMSYTLYVDGSIEAELPQGTVRFASITELREHLENKDS